MVAGMVKVLTWNVNGIRSIISRQGNLKQFLDSCDADLVCVQETKLRRSELTRDVAVAEGWESFWNCCQPGIGAKSGYSGVATFCKSYALPIDAQAGLTGSTEELSGSSAPSVSLLPVQLSEDVGLSHEDLVALDSEGRALVTDHGMFILVNLYGPALTIEERIEERLAFKLNFYRVLEWRIRRWVSEGRAVLVVGDLNISPHPIDSCKPHPISDFVKRPDRQWLVQLLSNQDLGVCDVFRHFHPDREHAYTCWNTASGARLHNYGSRIDHILVAGPAPQQLAPGLQLTALTAAEQQPAGARMPASAAAAQLLDVITACDIRAEQQGSDHAPVWAALAIPPELLPSGHAPPPGAGSRMFPGRQASLKAWLHQPTQSAPQPQSQSQSQVEEVVSTFSSGNRAGTASIAQQQQEQGMVSSAGAAATGSTMDGKGSQHSGGAAAAGMQGTTASAGIPGSHSATCSSKRPAATAGGHAALKRPRAGAAKAAAGKGAAAGQQLSVRKFFCVPPPSADNDPQQPNQQQAQQRPAPVGSTMPAPHDTAMTHAALGPPSQQQHTASVTDNGLREVLDAQDQASRAAWQRISHSMKAPCCNDHKEPCVIRTVKKKGPNLGRQFWVCARPEGPPPVGRCEHFQFASNPRKFKGAAGANSQ